MRIGDDLVSIIVPVYRVESVLRRCVDSILNQSYTNIEIILIDDGSPDSCPSICDEYAQTDSRIVVIHQKNKGPASARNAGLDIAKGNFIMCVDSDDLIHKDSVQHMVSLLKSHSADIIIVGYLEFNNSTKIDINQSLKDSDYIIISPAECLSYMFLNNEKICTPWAKMCARRVFENIRFPEDMSFGEDMYIAPKLFSKANKIILDKAMLYFYCQDGISLVRSSYNPKKFGRILATEEWLNFTEDNFPIIREQALYRYTANITDECSKLIDEKQYRQLLHKMSEMILCKYGSIKTNKYLSRKDKLKSFLIKKRFYNIYRVLRALSGGNSGGK